MLNQLGTKIFWNTVSLKLTAEDVFWRPIWYLKDHDVVCELGTQLREAYTKFLLFVERANETTFEYRKTKEKNYGLTNYRHNSVDLFSAAKLKEITLEKQLEIDQLRFKLQEFEEYALAVANIKEKFVSNKAYHSVLKQWQSDLDLIFDTTKRLSTNREV